MAADNQDAWIPVEYSADTIVRPALLSAVEATARREPMASESKVIPRAGNASLAIVPKNGLIPENGGTEDSLILVAAKFAISFVIPVEDLEDAVVASVADLKKDEFSRAYAKMLDNACLAVTAAQSGTTVPFTSLYRAIKNGGESGYTAGANYMSVSGAPTYAQLSALVGLNEGSDWYDPSGQVIIAHPSLKGILRSMVGTAGNPIFNASPALGSPDTVFGLPIFFTAGARTSAVATPNPTGNPLVFVTNPAYLVLGTRSEPESYVDNSVAVKYDQSTLFFRARKAFAVGATAASAVLEILPSA